MRLFYTLFFIGMVSLSFGEDCSNGRYRQPIFPQLEIRKDIVYARKLQSDGHMIPLAYDIYQPKNDTASLRPVMLLIHGGAYLKLLDQNSPDIVLLCKYFAHRGYVTISLDYRQEPNPLALLSEETMVKAVARALVDTKDATDHLMQTVLNGNPYRLDTSRAFIGGVSAGAVSSMFIAYLDSLAQVTPQYQQWIMQAVGDSADYILRHKFDYYKPKAVISISGALLDTSWMVDNGIDLFINHGSADGIVPYEYGFPLGINSLPKLYGGKAQYPRAINQGIRCEFEDWIGRGHVPFMNLTFPEIILSFIDEAILDSTQRHIANFIYPRLGCSAIISGVQQHKLGDLKLYPNPNSGNFTMEIPAGLQQGQWQLQVFNTTGQQIISKIITNAGGILSFNESFPAGMYYVKLSIERGQAIDYYAGTFSVTR